MLLAEVGRFSIASAVAAAIVALVLAGVSRGQYDRLCYQMGVRLSLTAFGLITVASACLLWAFYDDSFAIEYVAMHSNTDLPIGYKLAAFWGGHEGSFLFMLLTLSGWGALLARQGQASTRALRHDAAFVMSALVVLFGVYCLLLSDPFVAYQVAPQQGRDLNPMLQDVGLVLHPPLLYLGYVGFAAPFALTIAALWRHVDAQTWALACREWTLAAWGWLTLGIVLGSWWAYRELGWGGWWFWDPVENASLLPWLTGTALVHSLIVTRKDGGLLTWSLLLALSTFGLSLLGTFIVRSGVLVSVHAFATDPSRGNGLLLLIAASAVPALSLYGWRATQSASPLTIQPSISAPSSRLLSSLITVMCALAFAMTCIVMLGTFYPMVYAALGLGTLSVGAPYFNSLFVPLVIVAALVMLPLSPLFQRDKWRWGTFVSVAFSVPAAFVNRHYAIQGEYAFSWFAWAVITLAMLLATCQLCGWICQPLRGRGLGKLLSHLGFAVVLFSAVVVSTYSHEQSLRMGPNDSLELAGYQVTHQGSSWHSENNYTAERVRFLVSQEGRVLGTMEAERQFFALRGVTMSEPALKRLGIADLYVTLGSKLSSQTFAVRVQHKPAINGLWLGGGLMTLGAILNVLMLLNRQRHADSRGRWHKKEEQSE